MRCSNCKDVPKQIEGMPQNSEAPHRPHNVHYKNVIARYFVLCRLYLRDKEQDDIGNVYHIKKLETDSEQGQEELDVSKTLLNLEHKLKITKTPF